MVTRAGFRVCTGADVQGEAWRHRIAFFWLILLPDSHAITCELGLQTVASEAGEFCFSPLFKWCWSCLVCIWRSFSKCSPLLFFKSLSKLGHIFLCYVVSLTSFFNWILLPGFWQSPLVFWTFPSTLDHKDEKRTKQVLTAMGVFESPVASSLGNECYPVILFAWQARFFICTVSVLFNAWWISNPSELLVRAVEYILSILCI